MSDLIVFSALFLLVGAIAVDAVAHSESWRQIVFWVALFLIAAALLGTKVFHAFANLNF